MEIEMKRLLLVPVLFFLVGCNDPAVVAFKKYETTFSCSKKDLREFETSIHKYFAGPDKLEFSDGSKNAFELTIKMNELMAAHCPKEVLETCSPGDEKAWVEVEASYYSWTKWTRGPLEPFSIIAIEQYEEPAQHYNIPAYGTYLTHPDKFRKAMRCYMDRLPY